MASEIIEITRDDDPITESNRELLEHILIDLHVALRDLTAQGRLQAKHDELLEEFRPLLERFRSPLASRLPGGRRNGRD